MSKKNNQPPYFALKPKPVYKVLTGITILLLLAHLTVQAGIYHLGAEKNWLDALNMDRELNIPTMFSCGLLFAITLLLRRLESCGGAESRRDWRLLSKIFAFLALDEALQIHEIFIIPALRPFMHPALASTWVIPYSILAFAIFLRFRSFLHALPSRTRTHFLQAGAVYIIGAIGMEMIGSYAVRSSLIRLHSPWYGAITGLEESLELFGLILLIKALMNELIERGIGNVFILQFKP